MRRTTVFVLFAFLGFLFAFAAALPSARSAAPQPVPVAEHVPADWVAQALASRPFMPPAR
ncbi:hypothetical protein DFH01_01575 [Falsiroseomonas bella]|uniref:Uncharacterized protein n=1 Tax=Falsiroseomonas bella TaxID=2184016 RepID=A0A317FIX2_9PROT|nr:hypothetical protein [Falsiroseomonas bella]PWS38027.1 hypothetical protein DFH01_01575 [Falsiroseomonas bella]